MRIIKMYKHLYISAFLLAMLSGCAKDSISDPAEYFQYLEDSDNGISKIRNTNGIEIKAKYMPSEYLCYQDMKLNKEKMSIKDSIMEYYKYNAAFLVTVGPEEDIEAFSVTKYGIQDMNEFNERANLLNFHMSQYFTLDVNGQTLEPIFCEMENVYELSYNRKFNVVFAPTNKKDQIIESSNMTLTFKDELYNTGTNKFNYKRADINDIPEIDFWNN